MKDNILFMGGVVLGVTVLGYLGYRLVRGSVEDAAELAGEVLNEVNPANPENVIFEVFTDAYQFITGSEDDLGTDIAELIHGEVKR